jgi:hypothetical protein
MYPAVRSGSVERNVFVDGSNAKNLSQAASMLGIDSYMIATGGWKISRENVDKLIPDLHELMNGLPAGTPIVLFCMDNSSFLAASEEGGMAPISKCVEGDHGYHVKGALVVAPERALQYATDQLKRVVDEFEDFDVFIISPVTRYVASPCCTSLEHVTNFGDPDFLSTIIADLTRLKFQLRKKFHPAIVIELACKTGCGREKVEQTLRAGWALDPVHPTGHIYAKMALNLIEKVANPAGKLDSRKRKRSDDTASGSGSQHGGTSQQARLPRSDGSRDRPRDPASHRNESNSQYSQYGAYRQENRVFSSASTSHLYRGRGNAGSVSSRGSSRVEYGPPTGSGRGGGFRGFRGGFGNRGSPMRRAGPRF